MASFCYMSSLVSTKTFARTNNSIKMSIKSDKISVNYGKIGISKRRSKWVSYGGSIPSMLQAIERINNLDEALKPWSDNLSDKERSIILNEQSNWERALEIFNWFKNKKRYKLNIIHYNIMLRILGRERKWDLMISLWCEMQFDGVSPSNPTYGTLIDVFSKGGVEKGSLVWLGDMQKRGLEPDEVTMGIVMQSYKKTGKFKEAQQFFKIWSSSIQSNLCAHTYNSLIDIHGKAGQVKEALDLFDEMLEQGISPNTITFNTLIHVCGNHGRLDDVAQLISKMEGVNCTPDSRTFNILTSIYVKSDDIKAAKSCFSEMKEKGLMPDTVSYRTLLYAFSIRHMVQEAEELVMEMEKQEIEMDEYTQTAITRMYVDVNMLDKAWQWFKRFEYDTSSECYAATIDAFGVHGHLSLAEKSFQSCVHKKKLSILVFNVMIKAYGIAKNTSKACDTFDSIEKHGCFPDKCAYNSLIQILCTADLPHRAKIYVYGMQKAGFMIDCVPYCSVISSFARVGDLNLAEDLFREMIKAEVQPDIVAFGSLINAFAEMGNVRKVDEYLDLMKKMGFTPNSIICNSLIKLYSSIGHLDQAQETYQKLQSFTDGPDPFASNCMINLFCDNSMGREAELVFEELRRKGEANEFSFSMMVNMYKKAGDFGKAIAVAQEMREKGLLSDALSFNSLISLYASDGRVKEAAQLFMEMMQTGVSPSDSTFGFLGVGLLKRGVSKAAIKDLELVRKRDFQAGLQAWKETICCVIGLNIDNADMDTRVEAGRLLIG